MPISFVNVILAKLGCDFKSNPDQIPIHLFPQALDYETTNNYTFTVRVREDLRFPADNENRAVTTAQVYIIPDLVFMPSFKDVITLLLSVKNGKEGKFCITGP